MILEAHSMVFFIIKSDSLDSNNISLLIWKILNWHKQIQDTHSLTPRVIEVYILV